MNQENKEVFTSYVNMNLEEMKQIIIDKTNLLKEKLNGNIDSKEKENSGYLFWNCKMLLTNIYMTCDKIIRNFKEQISQEEYVELMNKSYIIKSDESTWVDINSVRLTFEKIEQTKETQLVFYKKNESDSVWWVENNDEIGKIEFTFDKIKIYNLFQDYPYKLTPEEKEIFDRENSYWKEFFFL